MGNLPKSGHDLAAYDFLSKSENWPVSMKSLRPAGHSVCLQHTGHRMVDGIGKQQSRIGPHCSRGKSTSIWSF